MKNGVKWLGSILLILITVSIIGGLAYLKYGEIQAQLSADPPPEIPIVVRAEAAETVEFRSKATTIGTVLAPRSIILSNEMPGTVTKIRFQPGQTVELGEVLVEFDTSVLEAQLESALARLKKAEATFKRLSGASEVSAVTADEVDEAEATFAEANARVKELRATIDRKTLRAPFDARIGLSDTHAGQFLAAGTEIVSLQSLDDYLFVDFMIPQSAATAVQTGQQVGVRAYGNELTGEVYALDVQADLSTRSVMARAKIKREAPNLLKPGQSVEVVLEYGPLHDAVAIPAEALQSSPAESFVFATYVEQGTVRVRMQPVIPGPQIQDKIAILSGLSAGQEVITEGAFKLRNEAAVEIVPPESDS